MKEADCPNCSSPVEMEDDAETGDLIDCPDCGATLEVDTTEPLQFDLPVNDNEALSGGFYHFVDQDQPPPVDDAEDFNPIEKESGETENES
jgi:lysine biosynthesis protein LysW